MIEIEKISFDPTNREHINVASHLHTELLPESLLPKMGGFFMRKFYYPYMPKDDLIQGYLYKVDGEYAAFFTGTNEPFTFLSVAKKKYFWRISFVTLMSLLAKPTRIKYLTQKSRITSDNSSQISKDLTALQEKYGEKIGEFLSFGVLPEYRKVEDPQTGLKIPHMIMNDVLNHFRDNKKECFIGVVLKENLNAIKFYEKYEISYDIKEDDPEESFVMVYYT